MAKYKNISNLKILLRVNQTLLSIQPNEVVDLPHGNEAFSKVLVEVLDKPKDIVTEIKEDQASDLPEDCVVIVSDSIVEELKKDSPTKKTKLRKN